MEDGARVLLTPIKPIKRTDQVPHASNMAKVVHGPIKFTNWI